VPGCTDANKGDQALIWETIESIKAAGGIDEVVLIGSAEMSDQCEQQTRALGYEVVSNSFATLAGAGTDRRTR